MTDSERRLAAARPGAYVRCVPATPPHPGGDDLAASFEPAVIESRPFGWEIRGTRAALLAAGVCTAAHFPEGRKRMSWGREPGAGSWYLRLQPRGLCVLQISRTAEQSERHCARASEEAAHAFTLARRLARAHQSADEWRADVQCQSASSFDDIRRSAAGDDVACRAYQFSKRDLAAIETLQRRTAVLIASAELVPRRIDPTALAPLPDDPDRPPRLRAPLRLVRNKREKE